MSKEKAAPQPKEHFPFLKFLAFKSSDVTTAVGYLIVNTYLTMYCSDFLGLDTAVIGTLLLVSNAIDFVTDFIAAVIVDNTNTKLGRGRPYELCILGLGICTILMFATPAGASNTVKYIWVFCMYSFAYCIFNTFRGAAQNVYCIRAFHNNRSIIGKVSSYGGIVTTLGSMVVSTTFPILMGKLGTSASGWLPLVSLYMVPLTLIGLLRFIFVKEDMDIEGEKHAKVDFKAIFEMLKKNKYAWFYALMVMVFNTILSMGTLSYYWKYVVGDTTLMGVMSILGTLMLPIMLFFPIFLKRYSAGQVIAFSSIISAVGYAIVFFAKGNIPVLMGAGILTGFASLPISYLGYLFVMDLATYNAYLGLPRMESSIGAIFSGFGTQIGQGLGGFLTGVLLNLSGYVASTGAEVVEQPASAILMIRVLHSLVPMVMILAVGFFAYKFSDLSKKMPEIEKSLAERA